MRTTVPPAFDLSFSGREGPYVVRFKPTDEWDGIIDVSIGGQDMRWNVDHADREEAGGLVLGGMTSGSESLWNDQFWFELRLDDAPPVIRYWGDRVIWREDQATSA
jgi:hypothetical protein